MHRSSAKSKWPLLPCQQEDALQHSKVVKAVQCGPGLGRQMRQCAQSNITSAKKSVMNVRTLCPFRFSGLPKGAEMMPSTPRLEVIR